MKRAIAAGLSVLLVVAGSPALVAQAPAPAGRPTYTPDGVVQVPAFDLPPSQLMSEEARAVLRARAGKPFFNPSAAGGGMASIRARVEREFAPNVEAARQRYAVEIEEQTIAGVKTRIIRPKAGEANRSRVLINLHGGAFMLCADACALMESIPIAAVGRFKVVTVDYRMGPENVYPAASEDAAAVYQELLKTYRPENIGIYGCSAGGMLTAQAAAWLQDRKLPTPGALGIFGAGAGRFESGDSSYIAAYAEGSFPPPSTSATPAIPMPYFRGANLDDPLLAPGRHLDRMAKFPPTLIITGTRAPDLSPAIYTNNQLIKAGATSQLIVGEGVGHCYIYDSKLPESRDAYDAIVRFFDTHLGQKPVRTSAR